MPPLRERGTDIELLAQHFLDVLNKQESTGKTFAPATIAALYAHSWPGNVRELKNYVQRAYILADDVIDANLAPAAVARSRSRRRSSRCASAARSTRSSRRLIEATLAECGSKRKAADMLGISLKTLYNRLAAYKSEDLGKRRPPTTTSRTRSTGTPHEDAEAGAVPASRDTCGASASPRRRGRRARREGHRAARHAERRAGAQSGRV